MDKMIYTAMSGADRTLRALQVRANNLANAGTNGFRADIEQAASQAVPGYGYDARYQSAHAPGAVDARSGVLSATGRELDVAIEGTGLLAVATGDGGEAYTRAGNLTVDADGVLMVNGRPVLGDGGQIALPPGYIKVAIARDGVLSVLTAGETEMAPLDKLKLVNPPPQDLAKDRSGLLVSRDGRNFDADENVTVRGGYLEGSNVSAVEEMIATMALNRGFEMQMKMFSSANDMVDAGNRLIRG